LLAEKDLLHTCFTQNIDTLERVAGVPPEKIIEAHGSFATQRCTRCKTRFPDDEMKKLVMKARVPKCKRCGGVVKPDIVFFGEGLPEDFFDAVPYLEYADLLIIMGTSLTVFPFAGLKDRVPKECPRVLINLQAAGGVGSRSDDMVVLMDCDTAVRKLCEEIGGEWPEQLEKLWQDTEKSYTPRESAKEPAVGPGAEKSAQPSKQGSKELLEALASQMAKKVEEKMKAETEEQKPASEPPSGSGNGQQVTEQPELSKEAKAIAESSTPHYENTKSQPILPEPGTSSQDADAKGDKSREVGVVIVEST